MTALDASTSDPPWVVLHAPPFEASSQLQRKDKWLLPVELSGSKLDEPSRVNAVLRDSSRELPPPIVAKRAECSTRTANCADELLSPPVEASGTEALTRNTYLGEFLKLLR